MHAEIPDFARVFKKDGEDDGDKRHILVDLFEVKPLEAETCKGGTFPVPASAQSTWRMAAMVETVTRLTKGASRQTSARMSTSRQRSV